MSAVIRLARHGGKKNPFYRIVVTDKRYAGDGSKLEQLGLYDPRQKPSRIEIKAERLAEWLKRGALPSPTVKQLIKKSGVQLVAPDGATGESS
jgi:small subunit ribosomal protein S16